MRRSQRSLGSRPAFPDPLLSLSLMLLVNHAAAQDSDEEPEPTEEEESPPAATPAPTEEAPAPTATEEPSEDEDEDEETEAPTATEEPEEPTVTEEPEEPTVTEEPEPTTTEDPEDLPSLTTETEEESTSTDTATDDDDLPSLPTLPPLPDGVTIPTPAVPPKEGAPYLEKSNLPEGTVFIGVGAVLGLMALVVIIWRLLVAWSINRSVRRSAANHHQSDATALLHSSKSRKGGKAKGRGGGGGGGEAYRQAAGTSMSMEKLGGSTRHSGLPPRSQNPNTSLFFSPTAGASMHTAGNRSSGYLPAGYYAASNANAGGGSGLAHQNGSSVGLSPLGPQSQGYSRTRSMGPSPPGSPGLRPNSRDDGSAHPSSSNLNLSAAPQGRAPSAYLEDLFENHPPE